MKNTAYILAALAIAGLTASCQNNLTDNGNTGEEAIFIFNATTESNGPKATISGNSAVWDSGDQISLYSFDDTGNATRVATRTDSRTSKALTTGGSSSAAFTFNVGEAYQTYIENADYYMGLFKASNNSGNYAADKWTINSVTDRAFIRLNFPGASGLQDNDNVQTRVAFSSNNNLAFKNVWHLLRFTPNCPGATTAVLSAINGGAVARYQASAYFDSSTGDILSVVGEGGNLTSLSRTLTAGENYFALIPGMTITGGFKVELKDDGDNTLQTFTYAHDFTAARNKITDIANFDDRVEESTKAELKNGTVFNAALKGLADGGSPSYGSANTSITSIVIDTRSTVSTGTVVSIDASVPVYANFDGGVITLSTAANRIYFPASSSYAFYNMQSVASITNSSKLVLDNIQNSYYMFGNCKALSSFGDVNLPQASDTHNMFEGCEALSSLGSVNIPAATDASEMFKNCKVLATLGAVQMDAVSNASDMFNNCRVITTLTINGTGNNTLANLSGMFSSCMELTGFTAFAPVTSSATNTSNMFYYCQKLESVDISGIAGNLNEVENMFYYCQAIDGIAFNSAFNTSAVTSMSNMFSGCRNLSSLDLSMFNTSNVTSMYSMFSGCSKLTTIGASTHFTTTGLINSSSMFSGCQNLESVDVSGLEGNLQTIGSMFSSCKKLTTIHLSNNFNTAAVSSYASIFDYCTSLSQLYIKGFHLTKGVIGTTSSNLASRLMNALRAVPTSCTIHYSTNNYSTEYSVPNYLPYSTTSGSGNGGYNWTTAG